jgi:hypothetical protein
VPFTEIKVFGQILGEDAVAEEGEGEFTCGAAGSKEEQTGKVAGKSGRSPIPSLAAVALLLVLPDLLS